MKISVCLATYNGKKYLTEQIQSVLSQLENDDELLVSDDGSLDETVSILQCFLPFLKIISTDRIGGVVPNFERVISAASGNIIVLCDQDDVWLPGRLDLIRKSLKNSDLVILNGLVVDADLHSSGLTIFESAGTKPGVFSNLLKNGFVGCCMAFRGDLKAILLPFPSGVPWHDWYIGLVAQLLFKVEFIHAPTLLYRRHGSNFSPTGEKSKYSFVNKLLMRFHILRAVLIVCIRQIQRKKYT